MAWWKSAKPGDKVVCVKMGRDGAPGAWFRFPLVVGKVYEIQEIIPDERFERKEGCPAICLPGIEALFSCLLFRPVERDRTASGMKTIRKLLDTVPVKEDA
jgi:hypothetical protein